MFFDCFSRHILVPSSEPKFSVCFHFYSQIFAVKALWKSHFLDINFVQEATTTIIWQCSADYHCPTDALIKLTFSSG